VLFRSCAIHQRKGSIVGACSRQTWISDLDGVTSTASVDREKMDPTNLGVRMKHIFLLSWWFRTKYHNNSPSVCGDGIRRSTSMTRQLDLWTFEGAREKSRFVCERLRAVMLKRVGRFLLDRFRAPTSVHSIRRRPEMHQRSIVLFRGHRRED